MSSKRQLNYVNEIQNRVQNLYYVDDATELNNIILKENDKIYAVNDNKLFQMEIVDQDEELSGSIVNFNGRNNTKIKSVVVDINPVQDLHGYDHPWPAGGGKNLLNNTAVTTTSNGVTFTVNSDGTVSTQGTASGGVAVLKIWQTFDNNADLIINGCPSGGNYASGYSMMVATSAGQPISDASYGIDTGSGYGIPAEYVSRIAQVQIIVRNGTNVSGKVFKPMIRLASVSDDTYAPYSNVCPISGWTGCDVADISDSAKQPYFAGLLNGTHGFVDLGTKSWVYVTNDGDPYFRATISDMSKGKLPICSAYVTASTTGTSDLGNKQISCSATSTAIYIRDTSYTDATTFAESLSNVYIIYELATPVTPTITPPQYNTLLTAFNLGGWLVPISWQTKAGTQYGGYFQLNEDGSGALVADHKLFTWSSGFVPSTDSTEDKHIFSTRRPSDFAQTNVENWGKKYYSNILSLTSRGSSSSNMVNGSIYAGSSYLQMRIDSVANTQDAIDALLTATPLQIVAPLVTPLTYPLSASQIKTLLGTNNVWADTGDIMVKITEKGITAFELEPHI